MSQNDFKIQILKLSVLSIYPSIENGNFLLLWACSKKLQSVLCLKFAHLQFDSVILWFYLVWINTEV